MSRNVTRRTLGDDEDRLIELNRLAAAQEKTRVTLPSYAIGKPRVNLADRDQLDGLPDSRRSTQMNADQAG